jgi:gamma-glutamyl-gamma-aminobutyrate hydrolase PuuD
MKPLIGVTSIPRHTRTGFADGIAHETIPEMYLDQVRRAGGSPVVLPVHGGDDPGIAARLDGVLLTGGGDVDPARYGRPADPATAGIDHQRDEFELGLVRAAREADLPLLGICRGAQVLNVAFGGSLMQHVEADLPGAAAHWAPERWDQSVHPVRLEPGTLLAAVLGTEVKVNSIHHQGIGELGSGLVAAGRSPDGLVEAIEAPGRRFLAAVQWHPECLGPDQTSAALFQSFVSAAQEVRR